MRSLNSIAAGRLLWTTHNSISPPTLESEFLSWGWIWVWKLTKKISPTLMTFVQIAPPGAAVPMHIHHYEDESIYLLEGQLVFKVGTQVFEVTKGGTVLMPKGVAHGFRITGKDPAHVLFTLDLAPQSNYEEMFSGLVGLSPQDFDKIREVCARNNVEFLTPPQLP
jgi:quercetin dioxygenase-like cupin family protein